MAEGGDRSLFGAVMCLMCFDTEILAEISPSNMLGRNVNTISVAARKVHKRTRQAKRNVIPSGGEPPVPERSKKRKNSTVPIPLPSQEYRRMVPPPQTDHLATTPPPALSNEHETSGPLPSGHVTHLQHGVGLGLATHGHALRRSIVAPRGIGGLPLVPQPIAVTQHSYSWAATATDGPILPGSTSHVGGAQQWQPMNSWLPGQQVASGFPTGPGVHGQVMDTDGRGESTYLNFSPSGRKTA